MGPMPLNAGSIAGASLKCTPVILAPVTRSTLFESPPGNTILPLVLDGGDDSRNVE